MRRSLVRISLVALAGALFGCVTDSTIDLIAANPVFEPKKEVGTATGPMEKMSAGKENAKPASLMAGTEIHYGIQLAAYRLPSRVKKSWSWIKRRGGLLLADFKPH